MSVGRTDPSHFQSTRPSGPTSRWRSSTASSSKRRCSRTAVSLRRLRALPGHINFAGSAGSRPGALGGPLLTRLRRRGAGSRAIAASYARFGNVHGDLFRSRPGWLRAGRRRHLVRSWRGDSVFDAGLAVATVAALRAAGGGVDLHSDCLDSGHTLRELGLEEQADAAAGRLRQLVSVRGYRCVIAGTPKETFGLGRLWPVSRRDLLRRQPPGPGRPGFRTASLTLGRV